VSRHHAGVAGRYRRAFQAWRAGNRASRPPVPV